MKELEKENISDKRRSIWRWFYRWNFRRKGKFIWPSWAPYEGDFKNDKRNGKGKYTWANGDYYEGHFVDGDFTGKGKKVYKDGNIEEGNWQSDKFLGK